MVSVATAAFGAAAQSCPSTELADRVSGALWGMLIADALAAPTHWFYGGSAQVRQYFGGPIQGYVAPLSQPGAFPDSIMALSNTGGAGRGSSEGEIVGTVINHGKKKYWQRGGGFHYHCTLEKGENTLEGHMARLAMRSLAQGGFDLDRMQQEYVEFMTKDGTHNDAYASSYHRMFFQNRAAGKPLHECPSNDNHNVDAIDGLIIPAVVLLGYAAEEEGAARTVGQRSVRVTRRSPRVEEYVVVLSALLRSVLRGATLADAAQAAAMNMGVRLDPSGPDPVVACYIDSNFASLLHFAAKYRSFEEMLLANANSGGENVHRGLVLGALIGAEWGASKIPAELKAGLHFSAAVDAEIADFVQARLSHCE